MPRRLPFQPVETAIQAAVVDHWLALGRPNTLVAAIPNARAAGQPGLTKGLPDLLVLGGLVGVGLLELKTDIGEPSDEQIAVRAICERARVACEIVAGRDAPIDVLERWGVVRPRAGRAA